jgi:hypothetical protein
VFWNALRTLMSALALAAFTASFVTLFVQRYLALSANPRMRPRAA